MASTNLWQRFYFVDECISHRRKFYSQGRRKGVVVERGNHRQIKKNLLEAVAEAEARP